MGYQNVKLDYAKYLTICLWSILIHGSSGQFDANFTLQNVWSRLQPDMRSLIQCLSDVNHKKIKYDRLLDTGQGRSLPKFSQEFLQGKPINARILFMPNDANLTRFGAYECKITKKKVETKIVTLKLPSLSLAELDAVSPYHTASIGDDVELTVKATKTLGLPVKWMHNGKAVPDWSGLLVVRLHDVQKKDAGVYECFYEGRREEGLHALMRVIVRTCPVDLYGQDCDKECPSCYNGGICHDEWGVCICPAGFTGLNCEIACGGNHFGANCNKFCSPPKNNSNTDELCALHLFCKPDPYGCSCAPGFKGSKCMQYCEPGWYGADCKQPCHCAYGSSSCNRITGACDGGCSRGWKGHSCQIEDPNSNSTYIETTTMTYCPPGSYGPSCEKSCHCAGHDRCHIITGHCPSGCQEGWGEQNCASCHSGRFGENCESSCHCDGGHHNCDREGFCIFGCEAGWGGFTCQAECTSGRFGPNCASTCHCKESSPCDKITGECRGDCEAGYMGKDCQTLCPANSYGVNCASACFCSNGAQCNRIDGSCSCIGRWRGRICNESEPQILATTSEEVNTGEQVFLSCTADAVPEPEMNISCSEFSCSRVSLRTLDQNQHQTVIKVKAETAGRFYFLCTARNEHGFDMKNITLLAIDPPRLTTEPLLLEKSNNSIQINWIPWEYSKDIGGTPTDNVEYMVVFRESWTSDWKKVGNWKEYKSFVTVDGLKANTLYDVAVRCTRMKERGAGDVGPILQVKTECGEVLPGGVPQDFLPEKISQTSAILTWKHPSESLLQCPLVTYHMTYYPRDFEAIFSPVELEGIQNSVQLEDLTANINYVVRLYPVTELGTSNYYTELIMRTAEMVPGPVTNLECQVIEDRPNILLLSWEAPPETNGVVKGYVVTSLLIDRGQCGSRDIIAERDLQIINCNDTEITLQDLYPYSTYNISVQAWSSAGKGASVSELVTTPEAEPSLSPSNIQLINSTNNSLTLSWDVIPCEEANGEIMYYDYAYFHSEDVPIAGRMKRSLKTISFEFESVAEPKVILLDLTPFTTYGFVVAGVTSAGRGVLSDSVYHITGEGILGIPRLLGTFSITDSMIGVSWHAPEGLKDEITDYRVRAWLHDSSKPIAAEVILHVSSNEVNSTLLTGLMAATEYTITVEAGTSAGWGKAAEIRETTLEGAPGEPSSLTLLGNGKRSLNITWREPVEKNCKILGYKVQYFPVLTLDPVFNSTSFIEKEIEVNQNTTYAVLQDLQPSTQYKILVFAKTYVAYGPPASLLCWTVILGEHVFPSLRTLDVQVTNDTIPIAFSTVGSSAVYKYHVIVEDSRNEDPIDESNLSDYHTAVIQKGLPYYIAAELDPKNVSQNGEQSFTVGDRKVWGGYRNVHLNPGHEYKIWIRSIVFKEDELKSVSSEPKKARAGIFSIRMAHLKLQVFGFDVIPFIVIVMGSLVLLITSVFFIILAICYRREKKKSSNSLCNRDAGLSGSMTWSVMYKVPGSHDLDEKPCPEMFETLPSTIEKNSSLRRRDNKIAHGLRIENLEDYLTNAKDSNLLVDEFKRLVDGQIMSWTVARKSGNLKKNRYGNILPYDRHRVILQTDSNKGDDYINASFIDGFRRPREYIVTQGPVDNTVSDFWRMTWQENCPVIVMVTNLVENGKKKCTKYWPEHSMDVGDYHVLLIHSEQAKDYIVRTILVRKIDEIRTQRVFHYQYTAWPDRTVPCNLNTFIKFLKRIRNDHPVLSGPMVVHCSAGAGRSGTFISVDALCQQAAEEKRVDVFRFVNNSRHQRIHLVQTLEQYAFIYEALVEAMQFEDTSVPLEKIDFYLRELIHMNTLEKRALITKQYNKLDRAQKKVDMGRCSVALSEANIFKNRDPLTVPGDAVRIKLEREHDGDEDTDYINALYIDGYNKSLQFLVTQTPTTQTVEDFWRLIYQEKSSIIVMLNGEEEKFEMDVGVYWPEDGTCTFGNYDLQLITYEEQGDFIIRVMRLSNKLKSGSLSGSWNEDGSISSVVSYSECTIEGCKCKLWTREESLKVIQLQYSGCSSEMKPACLLSLVEMVERWYVKSAGGPITVHCMDGATRSGIYIAACHICDQIETEGNLDAYQIVKTMRTNRPEFIPNVDQYRLLFELAQEIAEPILQEEQKYKAKKLSIKI